MRCMMSDKDEIDAALARGCVTGFCLALALFAMLFIGLIGHWLWR